MIIRRHRSRQHTIHTWCNKGHAKQEENRNREVHILPTSCTFHEDNTAFVYSQRLSPDHRPLSTNKRARTLGPSSTSMVAKLGIQQRHTSTLVAQQRSSTIKGRAIEYQRLFLDETSRYNKYKITKKGMRANFTTGQSEAIHLVNPR